MPFQSDKQARFLFANKPKVAKEFAQKDKKWKARAIKPKTNTTNDVRKNAIIKRLHSIKLKRNDS